MDTSGLIINHLTLHHSATAAELSRSLDLTKADIHYHLRKLLNTGAIETSVVKTAQGAGRPARLFVVVDSPPLKLSRLVVSILLNETGQRGQFGDRPFKSLADRIAREILSCCPSSRVFSYSPAVKLNYLVDELKTFGFYFRWEAGKKGPILLFEREQFSPLIDDAGLVNDVIAALIHLILKETA